ncbi:MAG: hypothetical protein F9K23_00720 [Bacteroidetes bacterium]|nr:MAG: hypothetical protein F9K23_00720 [Bacteroidota bacterium]
MSNLKWPFAAADVQASVADAATVEVTVTNQMTIVPVDTMAQDTTVDLSVDSGVEAGAMLLIKAGSDGTARALVQGTGFSYTTSQAGTISKIKHFLYVFNGSTFDHVATVTAN